MAACPAPGTGIVVNGTTATEAGCTITTTTNLTPGTQANSAGTINLDESTITTTGAAAYGAYANGAGSTINLTDVGITTAASNGLFVSSGVITMVGGTVVANGASTNAMQVIGTGAEATLTDVDLTANGTSGVGAFVQLGGHTVNIEGGTITTTANGGRGVDVGLGAGVGSSVTLMGVTVDVAQGSGPPSFGAIVARNGSSVDVTDSTINSEVYGVHTIGGGARIDVIDSTITVTANAAVFGAYAQNATTITFDNSIVTTTGGDNAHGLVAQDGSTITAENNTVVSTSGANAQGAFLIGFSAGNEITLTDSEISTTGAGSAALQMFADAGITNTFGATDSTLSAANADLIVIGGGFADIDFTNVAAEAAGGQLLLLVDGSNPAAANLSASASTLAGDMQVVAGNTGDVELLDGTLYAGAALDVTNMVIDATSAWNMTGSSTITNDLTNSGLINSVTDGTNFKTLTVGGAYIGQGGALSLNTFLGSDGSASDLLVIDGGSATGNTLLRIVNVGGQGAATTGDGILVIDAQNGGTTDTQSFALDGDVTAGIYDYALFRGGFDGVSNPDDWFLRSGEVPRPETSLYPVIPALALTYGQVLMDTLHERIGEDEHLRGRTGLEPDPYWNGRWGRLVGQYGNRDGDSLGILEGRPEYDYTLGALQAGQDIFRRETAEGHRDNAGVYGAIGTVESDVTHVDGRNAGTNQLNAYSVGGYWTHYGPSAWYLDAVMQGTWYDATARPDRDLPDVETDGFGFAASIEGGHPFAFANGWVIEPQGQLIYQTVDLDDGHEAATTVSFQDVDSLAGRIGARVARSWKNEDNERLRTAWLRPSLWHNFLDGPTTQFISGDTAVAFEVEPVDTWLEIDAGIDAELSETGSVYANASYQSDFDDAYALSGKLGLKARW